MHTTNAKARTHTINTSANSKVIQDQSYALAWKKKNKIPKRSKQQSTNYNNDLIRSNRLWTPQGRRSYSTATLSGMERRSNVAVTGSNLGDRDQVLEKHRQIEVNHVLLPPLFHDPNSYMCWVRNPTAAAAQLYPLSNRRP